jgi:hypothetical protein
MGGGAPQSTRDAKEVVLPGVGNWLLEALWVGQDPRDQDAQTLGKTFLLPPSPEQPNTTPMGMMKVFKCSHPFLKVRQMVPVELSGSGFINLWVGVH